MFQDFEKWHGCKNDFAVMWIRDLEADLILGSLKRQASAICDRRTGIGADGILALHTDGANDLTPHKLTIINSDGSVALNCGNGLRCAALSVLKRHRDKGNPNDLPELVELDVEGRTMVCRFLEGQQGGYPLVAVEMGVVNTSPEWADAAASAARGLAADNGIDVEEIATSEVGNPHIVMQMQGPTRRHLLQIGPAMQSAAGLDGINVHITESVEITDADRKRAGDELGQSIDELYNVYVWERGAGETQACGSGACAVAAAATASGLVDRRQWLGVDMPGGRLYVKHESDDEPVVLAGPATFVYAGQLEI